MAFTNSPRIFGTKVWTASITPNLPSWNFTGHMQITSNNKIDYSLSDFDFVSTYILSPKNFSGIIEHLQKTLKHSLIFGASMKTGLNRVAGGLASRFGGIT